MSYSSDDFKNFINEKVWEYLPPSKVRVGNEIHVRCPLCGDSKKNVRKKRGYYYNASGSYFCFNCNASMSGLKLLEHIAGQDYQDIIQEYRRLKMKTGGSLSSQMNFGLDQNEQLSAMSYLNSLTSAIKPEWRNPLTHAATEYLEHRKVLEAPFFKGKLYSVFDKKEQEYILIPWKINGIDAYYQINDFEKHDSLGRKYIFPAKKEKLIYGLDNIDLSWPYIICFEGVYDSLFIPNAIAIGGKSLTNFQHEIVTKRYPNHQIVLSFDNDVAGLTAMSKEIKKHPTEFKYFKWFDENTKEKDVNDYILKRNNVETFKDKNFVEKLIVSPISMKMFLLQKGLWKNA